MGTSQVGPPFKATALAISFFMAFLEGAGDAAAKLGASVPGPGVGGGRYMPSKQPVNDEDCTSQRVPRVASGAVLLLCV